MGASSTERKERTMRRERLIVLLAGVWASGCAHMAGSSAASGAIGEIREEAQKPKEGPAPFEIGSRNMVIGALDELDRPERQAQLSRIMGAMTQGVLTSAVGDRSSRFGWGGGPPALAAPSLAPAPSFSADALPIAALGGRFSEGFTLGMSRQLQAEIGPTGEGPLAKSLATATEQMSQAAATGFAQGLTPELGDCAGADRTACTERRVQQLSRSAAVGFAQGLGAAIRIPLLIVAFVVGLVVALVFVGLVRFARPRVPT
jgi:hypothetical protein